MKSKSARLVRRNHDRYHHGRDDLNIVPMIDMMVILVFFLIFTAVFSKTNILQLNLPASNTAAPLDLPSIEIIQARGPFTVEDDIGLFRKHGVEAVLAKNSGGEAAISKIDAARVLGLPVVMVTRPFIPPRPAVSTAAEAVTWLSAHYTASTERGV